VALFRPSKTKLALLSELRLRRATASGLARTLGIHRAGIYRHLRDLEREGYVARHQDERKWVFYAVTDKAQELAREGLLRPSRQGQGEDPSAPEGSGSDG
jgi:DNA-binding MarR family transcriptional regulator